MEPVKFTMSQVIGGKIVLQWTLSAISDDHALTVATKWHRKLGLVGRYYCETSNGKQFQINN